MNRCEPFGLIKKSLGTPTRPYPDADTGFTPFGTHGVLSIVDVVIKNILPDL
jgi:hypothetical protein